MVTSSTSYQCAVDSKHLTETTEKQQKSLENHRKELNKNEGRHQAYKTRIAELERTVKAQSDKQTASGLKFVEMEEQREKDRAEDIQRTADIAAAMQALQGQILLNTAHRTSVSVDSPENGIDLLKLRVDEIASDTEADRTISKSRFAKAERSISEIRSELQSSVQSYQKDFKEQSVRLRKVEEHTATTDQTIQYETRRHRRALEQSEASEVQLTARYDEVTEKIEKLSATVDTRLNARDTKPIADLRKSLEKRIDILETTQKNQQRAKMGSSITQAAEPKVQPPTVDAEELKAFRDLIPSTQAMEVRLQAIETAQASPVPVVDINEFKALCVKVSASATATDERINGFEETQQAMLPVVDIEEFETFHNEHQVTIQDLVQRVGAIEAALPTLPQLSPKLRTEIDTMRSELDTLEQKRQSKDIDIASLRREYESFSKHGGPLNQMFATKAEVLELSLTTRENLTLAKTDLRGSIKLHFQQANANSANNCATFTQTAQYNFGAMLADLKRIENQIQQVSTPSTASTHDTTVYPVHQLTRPLAVCPQRPRERQRVPVLPFSPTPKPSTATAAAEAEETTEANTTATTAAATTTTTVRNSVPGLYTRDVVATTSLQRRGA